MPFIELPMHPFGTGTMDLLSSSGGGRESFKRRYEMGFQFGIEKKIYRLTGGASGGQIQLKKEHS
jgi:hypothetical protein